MSKLEVDAIEPQSGTTLTLGASGDTINVAAGATNNLGITMADQWRLTVNKTDNTDITANLERVDDTGFGYIGGGMTESSGIFTFPETGIYLILINIRFEIIADDNAVVQIQTTTDNSTYTEVAKAIDSGDGSSSGAGQGVGQCYFDVTDTSTHKVKFHVDSLAAGSYVVGQSIVNDTAFSFIRLGDT